MLTNSDGHFEFFDIPRDRGVVILYELILAPCFKRVQVSADIVSIMISLFQLSLLRSSDKKHRLSRFHVAARVRPSQA